MNYLTSAVLLNVLTCIVHTYGLKIWKPAGCKEPAKTGPCKASIKAWHYDTQKMECKPFLYGGCGGNGNNFETKGKCESRCGWKYNRKTDKCLLHPKNEKTCRNGSATATRWHFHKQEKECKRHIFQTCLKNPGGFATCTECLKSCHHHMINVQVCANEPNPK
uniref:Tissue factor pathway inhibitor n=1 Tax=Rhipicephalus zambeziensis TaxID=60191 RepID=A0A224YRC3_9ACAR